MRIPALFEAISHGNVKSEYIIGVRRIGRRQVRLKLVAEVVEPGQSPLHTHSVLRSVEPAADSSGNEDEDGAVSGNATTNATTTGTAATKRRSPRKR